MTIPSSVDGLPYAGDISPADAHALVLARLDAIAKRRPAWSVNPAAVLLIPGQHARGLRELAERHAPRTVVTPAAGGPLCEQRCAPWPCPDYRSAAAGIVAFPGVTA